MIVNVATCPHPPLLLSGVTGNPIAEVEQLRTACAAAVDDLIAAAPDVLVAVGSAPANRVWPADAASPRHFFAPGPASAPSAEVLPLSLAVARDLTAAASVPIELHGVAAAASPEQSREYGLGLAERPERISLLVMADGSARRGPKAPGYEDQRALELDRELEIALRAGDPASLLKLDPALADDLLIGGRAAWQVLAGACEELAVRAECRYSDDPFGVWYPVFTWTPG